LIFGNREGCRVSVRVAYQFAREQQAVFGLAADPDLGKIVVAERTNGTCPSERAIRVVTRWGRVGDCSRRARTHDNQEGLQLRVGYGGGGRSSADMATGVE